MGNRLRRVLTLLLLGAGVGISLPAAAETEVGVKAGTLGAGVEASRSLGTSVRVRGWIAAWDQGVSYTAGDIEYEGDVELANGALVLDWHPGGGSFRLTGGLAFNDNRVTGEAPVAALLTGEDVGELPFAIDLGTFRGEVKGESVGPYAGLGWSRSPRAGSGWSFSFDLGALYHGEPQAELEVVDSFVLDVFPPLRPIVDILLEAEERELEAEFDEYRYYPVVSFSISYRF